MSRVVFLGTPDEAVPTLELLDEKHDVAVVITQPDRPRGRSNKPVPPPVKRFAMDHGLPVEQPANRRELADAIHRVLPVDVGVVVAFGRILRPEVLEAPKHGLLNIHFSLLPRWRGAAPVARALMAGDTMTGVTIMQIDEGLDTGPVLTAQAIDIPAEDDAGTLTRRLAVLGTHLLADVLARYLSGEVKPVQQSNEDVTYADKIEAADRPIDPAGRAKVAVDKVRGLGPSPAATLQIDGEPHKILRARISDTRIETGTWEAIDGVPLVGFDDAAMELISLQPPGRNKQSGRDWVNGRHSDRGAVA